MQGNGVGSTVLRRQLGRRLRRAREAAGKTHADVHAARLGSPTKMWRIESGKGPVKPGDVWALAHLYGLDQREAEELATVAAGTQAGGWWEEYPQAVVPTWFGFYAELMADSERVSAYQPELVYGLLQTRDYATAIMRAGRGLSAEVIEQRVEFRLAHQRKIRDRGVRLAVVLGAGALALRVGSDAVMAAQVARLRELAGDHRIDIRVRPWSAGAHPAMDGAFAVCDFADPDDPSIVYIDTYLGGKHVEDPEQVEEYRDRFSELQDSAIPIKEYEL